MTRRQASRAAQIAAELNKALGANVVTTGADPSFRVEYLPTDLLPIDLVLAGGIARGRFVNITGAYSTLKSYIGYHAIAATQRRGGQCCLVDTEHAYDPDWATELGVDIENLQLIRKETGEEAIDAAQLLTARGDTDLIVFDSIAATLPQQEGGKRLHKEHVPPGAQARLMSAACRRLTAANTGRTGFIWINQLREQIGVTFGPTERQPGGRAMGYYASVILNIRKSGKLTREQKVFTGEKYQSVREEYGQTFRAYVEKSKLNRPFTEVFFDFRLEDPVGLDIVKFLFAQGVQHGLISKRGNTWQYGAGVTFSGTLTAVGKDRFLAKLGSDVSAQSRLEESLRRLHNLPALTTSSAGKSAPRSRKVAGSSASPSKRAAAGSTRTAAPAVSRGTALQRVTSSKSSTPARRTHSTGKTS